MLVLAPHDLLIVKKMSLIADYDKDTIFNLYQPLIGALSCALYMTLLNEAENQKILPPLTHEQLLVKMHIDTHEFLKARGNLEAIGLLKTFLNDPKAEVKTYECLLYAPKSPDKFFDNLLCYGLLSQAIGENETQRLKSIYNISNTQVEGTNISKSFMDTFHPDLNNPIYQKITSLNQSKGRKTAKIDYEFNYERFFEAIRADSQINEKAFNKKELKEIERLCALYGVDEISAANLVIQLYDQSQEKGHRVDISTLTKLLQDETNYAFLTRRKNKKSEASKISSESDLAAKINLMESISPKDYLSILQNGSTPASPDLKLIDTISQKFSLSPSVINALIDYVLATQDNTFPRAYAEKVAASLAREEITNVIDAMNYLTKIQKSNKKIPQAQETPSNTSEVTKTEEVVEEDEEKWDELLSKL